jgi:hypothetical protein
MVCLLVMASPSDLRVVKWDLRFFHGIYELFLGLCDFSTRSYHLYLGICDFFSGFSILTWEL